MSELHLLFKIGEADYALPAAQVMHLEAYEGATPVPGAPPFVAGLIQIRRRVVPVVDVRVRFGMPQHPPTLQSRVVVVADEDRAVGLLVDSAREVLRLSEEAFRAPPEVVAQHAGGFVRSVAQSGDRLLLLLDFKKVIGEEIIHGGQ